MELEARDLADPTVRGGHYPPVVVNRCPRTGGRQHLRVVLLNAACGRNFEGIAECMRRPPLRDADIFLLCEVDSGMNRSGGREVAADFAAMMKMSFAYIPEFQLQSHRGNMGNAILSSAPFESIEAVVMPNPKLPPRFHRPSGRWSLKGAQTGIVASVRFGGHALTLGVAHLHSRCTPSERARQFAAYMAAFPTTGPAIFGGDLNTTTMELTRGRHMIAAAAGGIFNPRRFKHPERHEPLFRLIRERGLELDGANVPGRSTFTYSRFIPPLMRPKLDWIAIRGLRPVAGSAAVAAPRHSMFAPRASDHDFVMVDIDLASR